MNSKLEMKNALQYIILSLSVGFLIIGIHQTMTFGLAYAYWIFMLSVSLLLLYKYRKKKED
jgi:hypothetical protein